MTGMFVFYVNYHPEIGQKPEDLIDVMRAQNKALFEYLDQQLGYGTMFIPVTKESCRVDKIDFEKPWPRYVAPHIDVDQNDKIINSITKSVEA